MLLDSGYVGLPRSAARERLRAERGAERVLGAVGLQHRHLDGLAVHVETGRHLRRVRRGAPPHRRHRLQEVGGRREQGGRHRHQEGEDRGAEREDWFRSYEPDPRYCIKRM